MSVGNSNNTTRGSRSIISFLIFLSFTVTLKAEDLNKQTDSLEFKLFYLDKDTKEPASWQAGFLGLLTTGSKDTKNGYGGAFVLSYDRFNPLILRVLPQLKYLKFERILTGEKVLSTNVDFDILISPLSNNINPYWGFGFNYYNNFWPTDETDRQLELEGYGKYTRTISYNYGSGWANHLRTGIQIKINNISLLIDCKLTNIKAEMPVIYKYSNGDEQKGWATYKLNPVSIFIGITKRITK